MSFLTEGDLFQKNAFPPSHRRETVVHDISTLSSVHHDSSLAAKILYLFVLTRERATPPLLDQTLSRAVKR